MKTFFKGLILGLAMLVALAMFTVPVQAGVALDHYEISIYADEGFTTAAGGTSLITSGITYQVLTAGSDTEATLYSDKAMTAMTNPVTTTVFNTRDRIDFYVAASVSSVDIIIVDTDGGYTTFLDGATEYVRTAIIDERPGILHHGMIWFGSTTSSTEVETGIEFQRDTAVHQVFIEIVTIDSTCSIDVGIDTNSDGTNGDSDGFIDGCILATAGFKNPRSRLDGIGGTASPGLTSGAEQYHWDGTSYLGALLGTTIVGSATTSDQEGAQLYYDWICDATDEQALVYVFSVSSADTAAGYIHFFFTKLR